MDTELFQDVPGWMLNPVIEPYQVGGNTLDRILEEFYNSGEEKFRESLRRRSRRQWNWSKYGF